MIKNNNRSILNIIDQYFEYILTKIKDQYEIIKIIKQLYNIKLWITNNQKIDYIINALISVIMMH